MTIAHAAICIIENALPNTERERERAQLRNCTQLSLRIKLKTSRKENIPVFGFRNLIY